MFKRTEYPNVLKSIKLTEEQTAKILDIIEQMLDRANRQVQTSGLDARNYFRAKIDGLNAIHRFFRGDMNAHDEFEEE